MRVALLQVQLIATARTAAKAVSPPPPPPLPLHPPHIGHRKSMAPPSTTAASPAASPAPPAPEHKHDHGGHHNTASNRTCLNLVIFKEPSAGSTWFTDELNGIKGVHVIQQLFTTRESDRNVTAASAWQRMRDLATTCDEHGPVISGFTQNPENIALTSLPDFTFTRFRELHKDDNVYLATWTRRNFVRRAFSILGFRYTCNLHNVVSAEQQAKCAQPYHAPERDLLAEIAFAACNNSRILALAEAVASPKRLHHMTYEEFKYDEDAALMDLLGGRLQLPSATALVHSRRRSRMIKRSPSNISSMLLNADLVNTWLKAWSQDAEGLRVLPLEEMLQNSDLPTYYNASSACDHMSSVLARHSRAASRFK